MLPDTHFIRLSNPHKKIFTFCNNSESCNFFANQRCWYKHELNHQPHEYSDGLAKVDSFKMNANKTHKKDISPKECDLVKIVDFKVDNLSMP